MARIKDCVFREIVRPLRMTFSTSLGQKQRLHSVIVQVLLEDGRSGQGGGADELHLPRETVELIRQALFRARTRLKGWAIEDYGEWVEIRVERSP